MKQLFESGVPIDESRISFIEKVVARLARRSRKTTTVMIPPLPISACVVGDDVRGDILRYMFCLDGTVDKVSISLNAKTKDIVDVEVKVAGEESENTTLLFLAKKSESFEIAESIESGEKVVISVTPRDPEERLTEVWVAFTWTPVVSEAKTMKLLIDDIEKAADEATE